MNILRRPVHDGYGRHSHPVIHIVPGFPGRPCHGYTADMGGSPAATMSGPMYQGMDPSNPVTYVRNWAPCPGMISYLNFDGAQLQARTPTQLQRGSQARPRRLRVLG